MTDSLRLSVPNLDDAHESSEFYRIADAARDLDGHDPFNDQSRVDVATGRRTPVAIVVNHGDNASLQVGSATRHVGSAITGRGELDLVIDPAFRGLGYGRRALEGLLPLVHGETTAWSHGDHPAARALAERFGFEAQRTLLRLRREGLDGAADVAASTRDDGVRIDSFTPEADGDEWVRLNALIFAGHPEQGALTVADLEARQRDEWFNADDFLIARDADGRMIGYNWLKLEPGSDDGEIYVVGVSPERSGRGLGRTLMQAGLQRLRERGRSSALLYVEADNTAAVNLYRSLGFTDDLIDVQYRRSVTS